MLRRNLYPRFHRPTSHGLKGVCAVQLEGAGMILALQLEDHVLPVQSAERLTAAPLDPRHAEHGGLHHISLTRQLGEQSSKSRHPGFGWLGHVVRWCHTRSVFASTELLAPVVGNQLDALQRAPKLRDESLIASLPRRSRLRRETP